MHSQLRILGILFDFDGTLTKPHALDFKKIKSQVGCPLDEPIWEFIQEIPDKAFQKKALQRLDNFELGGAQNALPNTGVEQTIPTLKDKGLKIGIITRNTRAAVYQAFENFSSITPNDFDLIITRNDPYQLKPHPEALIAACKNFTLPPSHVLMIGDFIFDIQAGLRAGMITAFLKNNVNVLNNEKCDIVLDQIPDLLKIII